MDESGDEGDYVAKPNRIDGSSRFFTLAGIIVDEGAKRSFKQALDTILNKYFKGVDLGQDFKLHYYDVRRREKHPYTILSKQDSFFIANDMFDAIKSIDCKLLSISLDLDRHCKKYSNPVSPRAYTLLLIRERFQYFLAEKGDKGEIIYEEFNSKLRLKAELIHKHLYSRASFPKPTSLDNVVSLIKRGDPALEPVLQFADFFAYAPWIRSTTNRVKQDRWNSIKHKYYNLDYPLSSRRGNFEI